MRAVAEGRVVLRGRWGAACATQEMCRHGRGQFLNALFKRDPIRFGSGRLVQPASYTSRRSA